MPKTWSGQDVIDALERLGFEVRRQRGSHVVLRGPDARVVVVPLHRELARGTLSSILRQAGITREQLEDA